jgi:hypothetical protein
MSFVWREQLCPELNEAATDDFMTTVLSALKVGGAIASIGVGMLLETWGSIALVNTVLKTASISAPPNLELSIYTWQALTYALSPLILQLKGRARAPFKYYEANKQWEGAASLDRLPTGFLKGGDSLWWGLPGMILFAPCMFKMAWQGKTVHTKDSITMLQVSLSLSLFLFLFLQCIHL